MPPQPPAARHSETGAARVGSAFVGAENAVDELKAVGYLNVRYYPGGKHDWITAGLPIERGAFQSR